MTTPPTLQLAKITSMAVASDRKSVSFPIVLANGRRYQLEVQSDLLQTCVQMFMQASALAAATSNDLADDSNGQAASRFRAASAACPVNAET